MAEEYDELVKKLEKLKSLYEQNLITEEEYNNRKNSLLDADFSNNSNSNNNSNGVVSEINQKEIAAESYFDSKKDKKPVSKIIIWLLILGLLAGVAVFLFGKGSSSLSFLKKDSPEKSVSSILDAVIDADFISLSKQLNIPQEEVSKLLSEEIGIENLSAQSLLNVQKTLKKLTGNIKYDLDTQSETDNTSTVKAYITMPDYVTGNMDELKEMAGEFILAAVLGSKEDEYVDIVCSCIDSITASKPTNDVEITVDLAVEKINGKWTVVDILDIDGGVLGMLVDLGDLFGNTTASSQSSKLDNILSGFNNQNSSQNSTSNKNVLYTGTTLAEMHVRKGPGTSYEVTRNIAYGTTVSVYEEKQAEGYLWRRISENEWIADDGTWFEKGGASQSSNSSGSNTHSQSSAGSKTPSDSDMWTAIDNFLDNPILKGYARDKDYLYKIAQNKDLVYWFWGAGGPYGAVSYNLKTGEIKKEEFSFGMILRGVYFQHGVYSFSDCHKKYSSENYDEQYKSEHDWLKSKLGDDYLGTFELWSVTVNGAKEEYYYASSYPYNLVIKK